MPGKICIFAFGRERPTEPTWTTAASGRDAESVPAVGGPHGGADDTEKTNGWTRRPELPKTTHEDASRCSGPSASDSLLSVKQAPKAHHLPEKFVPAAINGEYVDFSEVWSFLSVWRPTHRDEGTLRTLSGELIPIARPPHKRPVDSFDVWLQVWTEYEMDIVSARPERYLELATYREQIQLANRKFGWPSVYLFDIQTRVHAASRLNASTYCIQPCIQPSSTLPPFSYIQSNVPVASPSIISCGIVPFSRTRSQKRRRTVHRSPRPPAHRRSTHGNCRSGSPPLARKAATFINESGVTSERLQASPRVQSLSGGPPPGRLPTFYRKSSHRLTWRPGANLCEHTRALILWLIYCMTLNLDYALAINPQPALFVHRKIIYLRDWTWTWFEQ